MDRYFDHCVDFEKEKGK